MSWSTKGLILLTLVISTVATAARITFQTGEKASLQTILTPSNSGLSTVESSLVLPSVEVIDNRDGFQQIEASGLYPLETAGNPELATTGQLIAVPAGFEPVLEVLDHKSTNLPGTVARPHQTKYRCDCPEANNFRMNSALYNSNLVYPTAAVRLEEAGNLRGVRLVRLAFYPIQQNFASKSVTVTTNVNVRVTFKETTRNHSMSLPQAMFNVLKTAAINGSEISRFATRAEERVLIFTADALKATVEPLANWKRARGYQVGVVTFTEGGATKEKVKAYIQKEYDSGVKPTYLIFVGNKTTMPGFSESTGSGSAATDYTYAILTGDDKIPDAFYGRIIADNEAEAKLQIDRWIAYEKAPESKGAWYHDGLTIASSEGSGPSDKEYAEQVREALTKGTYKDFGVFLQADKTAKAAKIIESLNPGKSWIAYFGHGTGTAWGSTNDTFDNKTVDKLENGGKLPILIDVACQNGSWVKLPKPFAKAWVTHTKNGQAAGAVAFLGGSVNVSWHPPAVMSLGIAKAHFEKPVHHLGGSVIAGQLYLMEKMGTGNDVIDNFKWYNLFGDPSMLIRTDSPKSYQVGVDVAKDDNRTVVSISAKAENSGVKGLTVALTDGSKAYGSAVTDALGEAKIEVSGSISPTAKVTTTGYNAETLTTDVE